MLLGSAGLFLVFGHFFHVHGLSCRANQGGGTVLLLLHGVGGDLRRRRFRRLSNALALVGMMLVIGSGLAIVLIDERKRRLVPVA